MFLSDIFIQDNDEGNAQRMVWDTQDLERVAGVDVRRRKRALRRSSVRRHLRHWGAVISLLRRVVSLCVVGILVVPLALTGGLTVLMMRLAERYSRRSPQRER
ncbi:MAG: hypothetical protein AABY83_07020 [Pseudomonadota bacterium]